MNVFVLCTGRCGSTTFARACSHLTNYTAAHESRMRRSRAADRLAYSADHVEIDNRLSWLLGRLDRRFGKDAFYVHLTRDPEMVARSYLARWNVGIMRVYRSAIAPPPSLEPDLGVAADMIDTITTNIELFLRDKPHQMPIQIENGAAQFPAFWQAIGGRGDLDAALHEFSIRYNAARPEAG